MTNYFSNCRTQDELKTTYKELAKKYHPDIYGEEGNEILKEIHSQLEKAAKNIDKNYFCNYVDSDKEEDTEIKTKKQELVKEALKYIFPEGALFALYWENGVKPYNHRNPLTQHNFSGWNIWTLEIEMILKGYNKPEWSSFPQYRADKNPIKKGEHGKRITLAITGKDKDEDNEEQRKSRVFYKGYTVFNISQTQNGANSSAIETTEQLKIGLNFNVEKAEETKETTNKIIDLIKTTTPINITEVNNLPYGEKKPKQNNTSWDNATVVA